MKISKKEFVRICDLIQEYSMEVELYIDALENAGLTVDYENSFMLNHISELIEMLVDLCGGEEWVEDLLSYCFFEKDFLLEMEEYDITDMDGNDIAPQSYEELYFYIVGDLTGEF